MSTTNHNVQGFFDPTTWTISYVVFTAQGSECAIFDSVLDYDPKSGRTSTTHADTIITFIHKHNLRVRWIIETHAHADHLTAAPYLKQKLGGQTVIGNNITSVQKVFSKIFNLESSFSNDGSQFDVLLQEGETLPLNNAKFTAIHVPGHTPACTAYTFENCIFVGDTLFMPDAGTARCDFPGGDAKTLFRSIQKLLSFPPETKLYLCHDYPPAGREVCFVSTVREQLQHNIHVRKGIREEEFVAMRTARDLTLEMPTLILPSVQINIRAGEFPPKENNGIPYLKIPLNGV